MASSPQLMCERRLGVAGTVSYLSAGAVDGWTGCGLWCWAGLRPTLCAHSSSVTNLQELCQCLQGCTMCSVQLLRLRIARADLSAKVWLQLLLTRAYRSGLICHLEYGQDCCLRGQRTAAPLFASKGCLVGNLQQTLACLQGFRCQILHCV